jgi:hypothetical protein
MHCGWRDGQHCRIAPPKRLRRVSATLESTPKSLTLTGRFIRVLRASLPEVSRRTDHNSSQKILTLSSLADSAIWLIPSLSRAAIQNRLRLTITPKRTIS